MEVVDFIRVEKLPMFQIIKDGKLVHKIVGPSMVKQMKKYLGLFYKNEVHDLLKTGV